MKIKCIDNKVYNLTVDKEYEVIVERENAYKISNDKGIEANYGKTLFEVVNEEQPIEEYDIRIERDRDLEVIIDNSVISELEYSWTSGNCGVINVSNINTLYFKIKLLVNSDERTNKLFERVIDELIVYYEEIEKKCILILSTNDAYLDIWNILDRVFDFSTPVFENDNPIKLWIKYLKEPIE